LVLERDLGVGTIGAVLGGGQGGGMVVYRNLNQLGECFWQKWGESRRKQGFILVGVMSLLLLVIFIHVDFSWEGVMGRRYAGWTGRRGFSIRLVR